MGGVFFFGHAKHHDPSCPLKMGHGAHCALQLAPTMHKYGLLYATRATTCRMQQPGNHLCTMHGMHVGGGCWVLGVWCCHGVVGCGPWGAGVLRKPLPESAKKGKPGSCQITQLDNIWIISGLSKIDQIIQILSSPWPIIQLSRYYPISG